MGQQGSDKYQEEAKKCTSLADLRKATRSYLDSLESMAPVKILLSDFFQRIELKKKKFEVGVAGSDSNVEEMWENVTAIDPSIDPRETLNKGNLSSKPRLVSFLNHSCRQRQYFFEKQVWRKFLHNL